MKQTNCFSMSRLAHLCNKELAEKGRAYLMATLALYGMMAFTLVWIAYTTYPHMSPSHHYDIHLSNDPLWGIEWVVFTFALFLSGAFTASFAFAPLHGRKSRIAFLMLPATTAEKFIVRWLIYTFTFLLLFLLCFYLADWTRYLLSRLFWPDIQTLAPLPWDSLVDQGSHRYSIFRSTAHLLMGCSAYLAFQSWFLLGSVMWKRYAFLRSVVVGLVIVALYVVLWVQLDAAFPNRTMAYCLDSWTPDQVWLLLALLFLVQTMVHWTLAYLRLREEEVVE